MRRATVPAGGLADDAVELDDARRHHLKDVLRLRDGDFVELLDGAGGRARGRLEQGRVIIEQRFELEPPPVPAVTLHQGLAKGDKMDRVVRPVAELGVVAFAPLLTERAVPRGSGRPERWRTLAEDALRVRGGGYRMQIEDARSLPEALALDHGLGVMFDGRGDLRVAHLPRDPPPKLHLFVGPEGGFTEGEVEVARAAGVAIVRLGAATLRTETAGPAAVAALVLGRWGEST